MNELTHLYLFMQEKAPRSFSIYTSNINNLAAREMKTVLDTRRVSEEELTSLKSGDTHNDFLRIDWNNPIFGFEMAVQLSLVLARKTAASGPILKSDMGRYWGVIEQQMISARGVLGPESDEPKTAIDSEKNS